MVALAVSLATFAGLTWAVGRSVGLWTTVVVHEGAHWLAYRLYGMPVRRVVVGARPAFARFRAGRTVVVLGRPALKGATHGTLRVPTGGGRVPVIAGRAVVSAILLAGPVANAWLAYGCAWSLAATAAGAQDAVAAPGSWATLGGALAVGALVGSAAAVLVSVGWWSVIGAWRSLCSAPDPRYPTDGDLLRGVWRGDLDMPAHAEPHSIANA